MKLAKIMLNARKSRDLRLHNVARATGISISTIHNIESGKLIHAKIKTLEALVAFYGLDKDSSFIAAERIPPDVFWKIIRCPALLNIVRKHGE
jgi:transcriptional regulator with XRE-family HTH domain